MRGTVKLRLYKIIFKRIITAPTTGHGTYLSLTNILQAARDTSTDGSTTVALIAAHLSVVNVQTVLVPALEAIVAKSYLEWGSTNTLRIL